MTSLTTVGAVFAKVETTPGVDAVPTTTGTPNDFILALNASFSPDFKVITRNYMRPSISDTPIVMGQQLSTLTFTTEVFGTGLAATTTTQTTQNQATPKWADLFQGCAMVPTSIATPAGQTYSPITSSQKTLTLYCWFDGLLHKLTGAMGTFKLNAVGGELATIEWTFTGVFNAPTAVATPTAPFTQVVPPLMQNAGFAIGATASTVFVPEMVSIDIGNTVTPRQDANSAKGFNSMIITDRDSKITFNPEFVPEASHPFWGDFASANIKAINFQVGTVAGNQMTVSIPNFQISGLTYSDRNGIRAYEVSGEVSSTSTAGNDEIVFKFL